MPTYARCVSGTLIGVSPGLGHLLLTSALFYPGGTAAQGGGADCPGSFSLVLAEPGYEPHCQKAALWGPPNLEKSLQACSVAFLGLLALPADKLDK